MLVGKNIYGLVSSSLQREEDLYRACLEVDDIMRKKEKEKKKKRAGNMTLLMIISFLQCLKVILELACTMDIFL